MIILYNYKPKWTASLSSAPSSYLCPVQRHSPGVVPLQGVECGTHSTQGCKKASGKEVGKKTAARGEPPPAADSTEVIARARAGDSAFLPAGNALVSCPPYTPELPPQVGCYQTQVSLPKQPHQSCLSAPGRHTYCAKSTPRAECTGAGLGRMTQLHQQGCSSFPCLLKPSSNTAQAQPVAALLWALSHRNPGKQSRREVRRRTALSDLML